MFTLHPQLAADTETIATLALSRILLMNDSRYPWLILVPELPDLRDLHDLEDEDYNIVASEIRNVSTRLASHFSADKMNVAALGNMVPQLHIHIIARFASDAAWPKPVWGVGNAESYTPEALSERKQQLTALLDGL
ncbi:MAG: HIT domain-containing protein [Proteobacteria bacterium]|nr:HIT domain-containing protein [Pseudomonadota bacterium]